MFYLTEQLEKPEVIAPLTRFTPGQRTVHTNPTRQFWWCAIFRGQIALKTRGFRETGTESAREKATRRMHDVAFSPGNSRFCPSK
jgi:hypothetical protein